ncbi:MAG: glycosyltransferase family 4 protein [Caldilineales bacterium]|nr:glycosyltransferase family 4 protein [Caldilineales bacterium]
MRAIFYQSSPQHLYGGQLDLLRFLRACDRNQLNPHVIVPGPGPFVDRLAEIDIPATQLALPPELAQTGGALLVGSPMDRARQLALLTPWNRRLAALLRALDADVLYANNRRAVLTTGMGARLAGVPLFWHIKQDLDRGRIDNLALRLATYAAACSRDVQAAFQRRHKSLADRIGYAPYGIPLADFTADGPNLRDDLGISAEAVVVGLAGSISPRKGVDLFVRAALHLAEAHPDAVFVIAGDAPDAYQTFKHEILALAQPLIETGRFLTPGYVGDMPAFYRTLDLLAAPSRVEGFGLVIAEAGAAGVPAVRSATGGHTESTIDGKTGFVTPIDDLPALTVRLDRLLADPELRARMGVAAREHIVANFSLQRFVDGLTAALERTAGGR